MHTNTKKPKYFNKASSWRFGQDEKKSAGDAAGRGQIIAARGKLDSSMHYSVAGEEIRRRGDSTCSASGAVTNWSAALPLELHQMDDKNATGM